MSYAYDYGLNFIKIKFTKLLYMSMHFKEINSWSSSPPHSPPPGRSFQGVKAQVGAESVMHQHFKQVSENTPTDWASKKPFQGVKANVDESNFLYSEYKKNSSNMSVRKRGELKPHVGGFI